MRNSRIRFQWTEHGIATEFRTGVSLHSHTSHSKESLDFIYRAARHSGLLRWTIRRGEESYRESHNGANLDFARGWWTPPLGPADAHAVESAQLTQMELSPIVSLTDHDDIEAPMSLQAVDASRCIPVSVEWTVPFRGTVFHIGVHNLPPFEARAIMKRLAEFTANPAEHQLRDIYTDLHSDPGCLIVFNHPMWDEMGVGAAAHIRAVQGMLGEYGSFLDAVEINGLRPWKENLQAIRLGREWSKPVISGGDRHAVEPNATLNLSNAATFAEFAGEVREGYSQVLITSHYQYSYGLRIFQNMLDVFRFYENHSYGWKHWADRVFYTQEDGVVASLTQIWGNRPPAAVGIFAGAMQFAGRPSIRQAMRSSMFGREEVAL